MKRTTIFIDQALERDLKALAEREGRPKSSLVREAIREYVVRRTGGGGKLRFVAAGRSGRGDIAERHEDLLWRSEKPTEAGRARGADRKRRGKDR